MGAGESALKAAAKTAQTFALTCLAAIVMLSPFQNNVPPCVG